MTNTIMIIPPVAIKRISLWIGNPPPPVFVVVVLVVGVVDGAVVVVVAVVAVVVLGITDSPSLSC